MTAAQRRYVRTETIVGAVINAVLSIVFLLIVFGGQRQVAVAGLIVDAVPQTLMIALMSMLVPTWLTRRRVAAGRITPLPAAPRKPRNMVLRGLLVAIPAAIVAWLLHALLLPLTGPVWPFAAAALFKPHYGTLLGAIIARLAVIRALADRPGDI